MNYNKEQNIVIKDFNGPMMVISCAGSGKTTVITERVKSIVESGVDPSRILVVTFSKAAAEEMQDRYEKKYGSTTTHFSTIHSLCYSVLAMAYGINASTVLNSDEKHNYFLNLYYKLEKAVPGFEDIFKDLHDFSRDMSLRFSRYMMMEYRHANNMEAEGKPAWWSEYKGYEKYKKKNSKIDFDDMIVKCHESLTVRKDLLDYWKSKCDYILIDEFQDTSAVQAEIFYMLAEDHKNICVVGDDDQSIYGFRGADSDVFKSFLGTYSEATPVYMTTNYRSLPMIVQKAAKLIAHNIERFDKKFLTDKIGDAHIERINYNTEFNQASRITTIIKEYKRRGDVLSDIAVLYRVRSEARLLCNRLLNENIPFYTKEPPEDIHRSLVFYDIMAYYRLSENINDAKDLPRIINRPTRYIKQSELSNCRIERSALLQRCLNGISDDNRRRSIETAIDKLLFDLKSMKGISPENFMLYLRDAMKYREALKDYASYLKLNDITIFVNDFDALLEESKGFKTFREWMEFSENSWKETLKKNKETEKTGVYLSTFHGAKGLQWKTVVLLSAKEGITPLIREGVIDNLEEERRLFYVAMTRAEENLYLSIPDNNIIQPSRFVFEMGE